MKQPRKRRARSKVKTTPRKPLPWHREGRRERVREVTRAGLEIPACPLAFASHRGQRRDGDHHIRLSELIGVAVVGVAAVSWRTDRQPRDRPFLCAGRENISFFLRVDVRTFQTRALCSFAIRLIFYRWYRWSHSVIHLE